MTGEVTGGNIFVLMSYVVAAVTLLVLAGWTVKRFADTKKRLAMLNESDKA